MLKGRVRVIKNPFLPQVSINSELQVGIRNLIGHHPDRMGDPHMNECRVKFGSVVINLAAHRTGGALKTADAQFLLPKFLI